MKKLDLKQMEKVNGGSPSPARCARMFRRYGRNGKEGLRQRYNRICAG